MFESIIQLQKRISPKEQLEVFHNGYSWIAKFEWRPPASHTAVRQVLARLDKSLPIDYIKFLEQISNGGLLFYDGAYGQYGFKIFGIDDLIDRQAVWQKSLGSKWRDQFVAFAELYGESNVMVFDLKAPSKDSQSYAVMEANPIDSYENFPKASRSFHEWLDHLITAQGAKYWEWW